MIKITKLSFLIDKWLSWNDWPSLVFPPDGTYVTSFPKSHSFVPRPTKLHTLCNQIYVAKSREQTEEN